VRARKEHFAIPLPEVHTSADRIKGTLSSVGGTTVCGLNFRDKFFDVHIFKSSQSRIIARIRAS
jgi:hypothetical protein